MRWCVFNVASGRTLDVRYASLIRERQTWRRRQKRQTAVTQSAAIRRHAGRRQQVTLLLQRRGDGSCGLRLALFALQRRVRLRSSLRAKMEHDHRVRRRRPRRRHLRVHSATACACAAPPQRRAPCRRQLQRRCPGAAATAGSACTRACARTQPRWARRPPTTTRPLQRRRASAGVGACAPRVCRGGGFGRRRHLRSTSRCTSQQRGKGALGDAAHGRRRVWHGLAVARRAAVVRRSAASLPVSASPHCARPP